MALGDTTKHQALMNRMATVQGFDLGALRAAETLSDADMSDLLTRCRNCDDPNGCAGALAKGDTPSVCANDNRWDALRKVTRM